MYTFNIIIYMYTTRLSTFIHRYPVRTCSVRACERVTPAECSLPSTRLEIIRIWKVLFNLARTHRGKCIMYIILYVIYIYIYIIGPCYTAAELWYNNIRVYTGSSEFYRTQIVCGVRNCIKNHNKKKSV